MAGPELTDPRAPRVRRARRLARRAGRDDAGQFLVEGAQAVSELLAAGVTGQARPRELFVSAEAAERHPGLVASARGQDVPVHLCGEQVLAALSDTVTPQGLVAVSDALDVPLTTVLGSPPRLVAFLASVRDPGNAGSVLRAADAAGADSVWFSHASVDPYNPKAVRASVGSLFHLPVVTGLDVADAVAAARAVGLQVLAADGTGATDLDDAEEAGLLARPTVWLFGNEAWGLTDELRAASDAVVRIPLHGRAESLNLATAAALCLYASARAFRRAGR